MLRVELSWPDSRLNPNRAKGMHWSATSNLRTQQKSDARLLTLRAMRQIGYVPPVGVLALTITFVQPDRRARDRDNLLAACKSMLDGVSQALGVDDQHFEPLTVRREYGKKPGAVLLEIGNAVKE